MDNKNQAFIALGYLVAGIGFGIAGEMTASALMFLGCAIMLKA